MKNWVRRETCIDGCLIESGEFRVISLGRGLDKKEDSWPRTGWVGVQSERHNRTETGGELESGSGREIWRHYRGLGNEVRSGVEVTVTTVSPGVGEKNP